MSSAELEATIRITVAQLIVLAAELLDGVSATRDRASYGPNQLVKMRRVGNRIKIKIVSEFSDRAHELQKSPSDEGDIFAPDLLTGASQRKDEPKG